MQHVLSITACGLVMQLDGWWDGSKNYKFEIDGISDLGVVTELNL